MHGGLKTGLSSTKADIPIEVHPTPANKAMAGAVAQRRYLEPVSPYARRLFHQLAVPEVDDIEGLPPAIALQQQRSAPTTRSSVGSVRTLSNLLRMLSSRAGDYPAKQPLLSAEAFSPNTPEGARGRHFKSDSSSYSSRGAGDHRDLVWQQGCSRRSGTRRALGKGELQAAFRQIRTKDLRPSRGRRSVSITDLIDNPSDTQLYPVRLSSSPCPCREPRRREEPRAYWLSDRAHRRQGYRIPSQDQP